MNNPPYVATSPMSAAEITEHLTQYPTGKIGSGSSYSKTNSKYAPGQYVYGKRYGIKLAFIIVKRCAANDYIIRYDNKISNPAVHNEEYFKSEDEIDRVVQSGGIEDPIDYSI